MTRERFDVDGVSLEPGHQVALLGDGDRCPVLLLEVADLPEHTPMIEVRVVELLEHPDAHLFAPGETFQALGRHLSRRLATTGGRR